MNEAQKQRRNCDTARVDMAKLRVEKVRATADGRGGKREQVTDRSDTYVRQVIETLM